MLMTLNLGREPPTTGTCWRRPSLKMEQRIGNAINQTVADRGCRGQNVSSPHQFKVCIAGQKRRISESINHELRRRYVVEYMIGLLEEDRSIVRNFPTNEAGAAIHELLAVVGYNFKRILAWMNLFFAPGLVSC